VHGHCVVGDVEVVVEIEGPKDQLIIVCGVGVVVDDKGLVAVVMGEGTTKDGGGRHSKSWAIEKDWKETGG